MASWGNQQNAQFEQDMDSSNGTFDKLLCVRNASASGLDGNWRAEIKETGNGQALKMAGKIRINA